MEKKIKLSVLDQSPINKGQTASEALKLTTELATYTDRLGYTRFWVSEHHNTPTLAGTSPEILIAHLADHTKRMRIGSGGIMLPNHSALKMAENFRLLEALFPGRIDMGIGRAPGTDRLTASLLNPSNEFNEEDFIHQLYDLDAFFHESEDKGAVYNKVKAYPSIPSTPQRWLLTSSGESGAIAAHFGMALSYAQFINARVGVDIVQNYKRNFKPSVDLATPQASVAIFAFCSDDEEKIKRQQALMDYRFIALERGVSYGGVSYDDIKATHYTDFEKQRIQYNRGRTMYGTPDEIRERIIGLSEDYGVDEIMLITYAEHFEDRLKSYKLLSDMFLQ